MNHRYYTAFLAAASATTALVVAYTPSQAAVPVTPALELVQRVTPEYAGKVQFRIDEQSRQPVISAQGAQLLITAKSVRECIRGYGYYLRKMARVHLSWNGDNRTAAVLVLPEAAVTVPEALPFNYAYNYCTLSYTGSYWTREKWEQEIDRLALAGYTHALVTAGLERVWQNFLLELGYPEEKIARYIPNPAYAAWWNMGNLEGEGGPVSPTIINHEVQLGRFLVERMTALGMEPVLQGYVGFLPHDMPAGGIQGRIIPQGKWCNHYMRPAVLQPTAPDFPRVAALWYKHLKQVYGYTATCFGGDLFHEGGRTGGTPLDAAAKAVQLAMQKAAPGSKWLIQAWGHNPHRNLVAGTTPEHTVILALDKNMCANHNISRNYQGRPHVWCELLNFGGNHGMYGGVGLLEQMTGNAGGAIGIGLLSEGLETNPLYYALLTERINNRGIINRREFLKEYTLARYGVESADLIRANELLMESVYAPVRLQEGCQESIICARPSLTAVKASTWSKPQDYYDKKKVIEAAKLMLQAGRQHDLGASRTFCYDLADVVRQVLADKARQQLPLVKAAFEAGDIEGFEKESTAYLQLIRDTASILSTSEDFLLGRMITGAESKGGADAEARRQMRHSLLQLITTWPPTTTMLNDYAHRQLAELMNEYYHKRWEVYFNVKKIELQGQQLVGEGGQSATQTTENNGEKVSTSFEQSKVVDEVQSNFRKSDIKLLTTPCGDTIEQATRILEQF